MKVELSKTEAYSFTVEPFHVDFTGKLFLGILGNHLLNAADMHSRKRGWGMDLLNENHFTWVLSRLSMEFSEIPAQYEHVEIVTWVENVIRLFTERNFLIRNADDGRIYGYARSIWSMIDTQTRKPADLLSFQGGDIMNYVLTAEEMPCPIAGHGRFVRLTPEAALRTIPTFYSDADVNGHVNSIRYIEHILDLFPLQQFRERKLHRFEIAYKAESYPGDTLTLLNDNNGQEWHVDIRKHVGSTDVPAGETVAQAKVCWQ